MLWFIDIPPPQRMDLMRIEETGNEELSTGASQSGIWPLESLTFAENKGLRSSLETVYISPEANQARDLALGWRLYSPYWATSANCVCRG